MAGSVWGGVVCSGEVWWGGVGKVWFGRYGKARFRKVRSGVDGKEGLVWQVRQGRDW